MRTIWLILFLTIISLRSFGQDSLWKKIVVNEVLTLSLPAESQYMESGYVKEFGGQLDSNFYSLQFFDTIFLAVKDEHMFQITLLGFISGRVPELTARGFDVTVFDTLINSTKGLIARFTTSDTTQDYKQVYFFITMANNKFYCFNTYSPAVTEHNEAIDFFFRSIKFNNEKLKETLFKLSPVRLQKKS